MPQVPFKAGLTVLHDIRRIGCDL